MATKVNISSYAGDVVSGDWSPAFTAAFDDTKTTGGTIVVDTDVTVKTTISFAQGSTYVSWLIEGDVGAAVTVDANSGQIPFYFGNCNSVKFKDLVFVGETGTSATPDCNYLIYAAYTQNLIVENCLVAGVVANTAIVGIHTGSTDGHIIDTKFGGCGGTHVLCDGGSNMDLQNVWILDYQNYKTSYYSRQAYPVAWIRAINPHAGVDAAISTIKLTGCHADEGAQEFVNIAGYPLVLMENCAVNLGTSGDTGINLTDVKNATIRNYWAGYNSNTPVRPAMTLTTCGDVTVDGLQVHNGKHAILVDVDTRLHVINSPEAVIEVV